jgi:hypothetical protein
MLWQAVVAMYRAGLFGGNYKKKGGQNPLDYNS